MTMNRSSALFLSLVSVIVLARPSVRAETVTLRAAGAEAVVRTEWAGRIMSYKAGGPDMCWTNRSDTLDVSGWLNYGGEKTWIGPQKFWPNHWPPFKEFDPGEYKIVRQAGNEVVVESGVVPPWGGRLLRTITLDGDGLRVRTEWKDLGTYSGDVSAPILWSVAQVPFSDRVWLRAEGKKRHESGFEGTVSLPAPSMVEGTDGRTYWAFLFGDEDFTGKDGFDSDLIAVRAEGGVWVVRQTVGSPSAERSHPDRAQFFVSLKAPTPEDMPRYMELEFSTEAGEPVMETLYRFVPCAEGEELKALSGL